MAAHRLERAGSPVFVLGGVVTGKIGGFAAATYLRGSPADPDPHLAHRQVDQQHRPQGRREISRREKRIWLGRPSTSRAR